jgi:hypothetical protein
MRDTITNNVGDGDLPLFGFATGLAVYAKRQEGDVGELVEAGDHSRAPAPTAAMISTRAAALGVNATRRHAAQMSATMITP